MCLHRHHEHGAVNLYNCGDVTVTNCMFYNNTGTAYFSRQPYQGNSGGLSIGYNIPLPLNYKIINISISNCNFTLNKVLSVGITTPTQLVSSRIFHARGGAVIIVASIATSLNCTVSNNVFVDNFAQRSAGALYILSEHDGLHQYYCVNNVFIRNSSPDGGALLFSPAAVIASIGTDLSVTFDITNCTFLSNVGSVYAGAIVFNLFVSPNDNVINVKDSIFYNNSAVDYSGAIDVASLEFFSYRNATPIRIENW